MDGEVMTLLLGIVAIALMFKRNLPDEFMSGSDDL
jgi:hypothetical protein